MLLAILFAITAGSPTRTRAQSCQLADECPDYPSTGLCAAEGACGDAFWACIDVCDGDASCCACGWQAVGCATSHFAGGSGCYLDIYSFYCGGGFEGSGIRGTSPGYPTMPDQTLPAGGVTILRFIHVSSGSWVDPPATSTIAFEITSAARFTAILGLPPGFAQPFAISTDTASLGSHGPGEVVDFSGLPGGGVTNFRVSGISPALSSNDPLAFPIQLAFSSEQASFDMTVPEPSGASAIAFAILMSVARRRRG